MNESDLTPHEQSLNEDKKRRKKSIFGALGVLTCVGLVIAAMTVLKGTPEEKEPEVVIAPKVDTLRVTPTTRNIRVNSQGSVTATREIKLISEVAGRVVSVTRDYADGGFFDAAQAIVTLDDRDYQLALQQAHAEVAKARELLAMEKGRALQVKREWRDIGDKDANALFLRKPQLASAEAALLAAEAARDKAKLNLSRTRISAPFNGRIAKKLVDVGQYVAPGTIIAEVYSTEAVQVRLPLTDRQVAYVDLPLTANPQHPLPLVELSSVHGGQVYRWSGKIVRTEGSLDTRSRVMFAVVEVNEPYSAAETANKPPLAVGMYVSAEIIGRETENVVTLPRSVLRKKNEITVVNGEDELSFKNVEVLQNIGDEIIVAGLRDGDRVLLTRVPFAVAGLKVDPDSTDEEDGDITDEEAIADALQMSTPKPIPAQEG